MSNENITNNRSADEIANPSEELQAYYARVQEQLQGMGERLRKLRAIRGESQQQVGEGIGVIPSTIGKYERHSASYPYPDKIIMLAEYFGVTTDYLLKGTDANPSVENNINGSMSNSSFIQANHGGVVINGEKETVSPEAAELLHIYEKLNGRKRLRLLNFAVELEEEA